MAIVPLAGQVRPDTGKGPSRKARRLGFIPGVMYGHGENPVAVSIPRNDFELALKTHRGGNVIVALRLDGGGEQTAIIREVQRDPISHDILHLDFHQISLTERVQVEVNIQLVGVPDGVKNGGGILEHITRSIAIECLPTEIPPRIEVDVSALAIGDSVHVREITVEKAQILTDGDVTIATVVPPTVLAEPVPTEAAATTAEPEVIAKGKGEEGAEKPEAGGKAEKPEKSEKSEKGEKKE